MLVETPVDTGVSVVCQVFFQTGKFFLVSLKQYVTSCGYSFRCCMCHKRVILNCKYMCVIGLLQIHIILLTKVKNLVPCARRLTKDGLVSLYAII